MRSLMVWGVIMLYLGGCHPYLPTSAPNTAPLDNRLQTTPAADLAQLAVQVDYRGTKLDHVTHYYVLLVPAHEQPRRQEMLGIFRRIQPPTTKTEPIKLTAEGDHWGWVRPYLYRAPGGSLVTSLPPGQYDVAAAVLLASKQPAQSPAHSDETLYPCSEGAASDEYQSAILQANEHITEIHITLDDSQRWLCP